MKTTFLILTTIMSFVLSLTASAQSTTTLTSKIVEIAPPQAVVGQTIAVRVETPDLSSIVKQLSFPTLLPPNFRRAVIPNSPATPRIFFTGANGQQTVEGQNITRLSNNSYSVRVPVGAKTGKLRYQVGLASSLSTPVFTLVTSGYTIANFSQFNIISIKVDNAERLLAQTVQATLPTDPNVFVADIGATPGAHSIQVTIGRSTSEPVMVYFLPSTHAASPFTNITVGLMAAGEYLTASPNALVANNNTLTASWQTLIINALGNASVNGFDFTYNMSTGTTFWKHWTGDHNHIDGQGTMAEPTNWPLNPSSITLALKSNSGSLFSNITVNLLNKTMVAADGNTYELQ